MQNNESAIAHELLDVQRTLGWMDLVIGSIDDAVYVTDQESIIVFSNQYFSDLVDCPRVFLLGRKLEDVFTVKPASKPIAEYAGLPASTANAANQRMGIYEWENKQGAKYIFRISQQVLATTNQTVYLAQNITREYELSRMKSNFIDLASHQLRTPMTAVMTYAHMLHDGFGGELTAGQHKLSATIIESSERMIKLVNDLLTITRAQNNKNGYIIKPVKLEKLFKKIETEVKPVIRKKHLQLTIQHKTTGLVLQNDENMLHEIFSNLIVNAMQYTPEGGSICVTTAARKNSVTIKVADTGIGIPKEYIPELFKQFSRAENAVEAYPDGTGLGLYMIKLLLEKSGGAITCKSVIGRGTTFTVTIPAVYDGQSGAWQ